MNNFEDDDDIGNEEEFEEVDTKKQLNDYKDMRNKKDIERVDNEHYDEAMVLNESDDNLAESKNYMKNAQAKGYEEDDYGPTKATHIPLPKFDTSEFEKLTTNPEYKHIMSFMNRFQVAEIQLDTKLKPFIPSYIPSIGEVDAFLKVNRPDKANEELGLTVVDEPTIEGVDPNIFNLKLIYTKKNTGNANFQIASVQNAEKNPRQVQNWIDKIAELHKDKMSSSVPYSKNMPELESLMQIWHEKMEATLNEIKLPDEKINMSTENYAKIVCNLLDIPIHKINNNKALIEALHVLFSLYSVVKENIGYKNIQKAENVQSIKFN